jgi:hypothetical protein
MEPMTHGQFKLQIQRLSEAFPGKSFNGQRLELIWKRCCYLPIDSFMKMIDHFIETFRYPPLPKDFSDAAKEETSRLRGCGADRYEPEYTKPANCVSCNDTGYLFVSLDGSLYLMNCECPRGANNDPWLPVYNHRDPKVTVRPFPHDRFVVSENRSFETILEGFSEFKKISRMFWQSNGHKCDRPMPIMNTEVVKRAFRRALSPSGLTE